MKTVTLSVIVPVYNEVETIRAILERIRSVDVSKEIIAVDDGSTDGTWEILESYREVAGFQVLRHEQNQGKGAAIRSAQPLVKNDIVLIQDADFEYPPEDYPVLLKPFQDEAADCVFGSRFLGPHRVFHFWHYLGNKLLTFITNFLYDSILGDMEVGPKAFRREVFQSLRLRANRFDVEPDMVSQVLKKKLRVIEVPITYYGRGYEEGKKITWRDVFPAFWTLIKNRFTP